MNLNINFANKNEKEYADILINFLENNMMDNNSLDILSKIRKQYDISEERGNEIAELIRRELSNSDITNSYTENEKDYYNFLISFIENNNISYKYRSIIDKKRIKNSISYTRAKELENIALQNKKIYKNI